MKRAWKTTWKPGCNRDFKGVAISVLSAVYRRDALHFKLATPGASVGEVNCWAGITMCLTSTACSQRHCQSAVSDITCPG